MAVTATLTGKARSFFRALWSFLRHGQTDVKTREMRKAICLTCPELVKASNGHLYCGACGCPQWWLSRLAVKWRARGLACPMEKW